MRVLFEASAFLVLALVAHLAVWNSEPEGAIEGAGAGGQSLLSIKASSASVARMVEAWETPPDVAETVEETLSTPDVRQQAAVQVRGLMLDPVSPPPSLPAALPALPKMALVPEAPALPSYQKPPPRKERKAPEQPKVSLEDPSQAPVARPAESPRRPPAAGKPVLAAAPPPEAPPAISAEPSRPKPAPQAKPKPARTPAKKKVVKKATSKSSAGANARVAEGTGGGVAKGNNKQARVATLSKARKNSLIAKWGGQIRARIARRAPRGEGRGTAVVTITVSASGALLGVRLAKSSGNPRIDKLALAAVRNVGRFPAAPSALGLQKHSFRLPVTSN